MFSLNAFDEIAGNYRNFTCQLVTDAMFPDVPAELEDNHMRFMYLSSKSTWLCVAVRGQVHRGLPGNVHFHL